VQVNIDGTDIGNYNPCYIVAEIGINHNGSIEIAKKLIDVAKSAGADAVKFQKRSVEIVYTPEELARPRESPFGTTNGDLKKGLEFGYEDYREIDDYCTSKWITWFASPWDVESVKFLENFDVPAYKVASACVTDENLLDAIGDTEKPVIISTGMSTQRQIDNALLGLNAALLACTSTYPCELKDLRLNRILNMGILYPEIPIGWSHHAVSPWPALCAVAMGAKIVECHITLDRAMFGSDQAASLEPAAFKKLVQEIRDFEIARGDGHIGPIEAEMPVLEKLRRFK
jgi:N-acetylneuraminate synthase